MKPLFLKRISTRAIQLDIGVTWNHNIVWFDADLAIVLLSYMTPEKTAPVGNFWKPFWRCSLFCMLRKNICSDLSASQRARCSLENSYIWLASLPDHCSKLLHWCCWSCYCKLALMFVYNVLFRNRPYRLKGFLWHDWQILHIHLL